MKRLALLASIALATPAYAGGCRLPDGGGVWYWNEHKVYDWKHGNEPPCNWQEQAAYDEFEGYRREWRLQHPMPPPAPLPQLAPHYWCHWIGDSMFCDPE